MARTITNSAEISKELESIRTLLERVIPTPEPVKGITDEEKEVLKKLGIPIPEQPKEKEEVSILTLDKKITDLRRDVDGVLRLHIDGVNSADLAAFGKQAASLIWWNRVLAWGFAALLVVCVWNFWFFDDKPKVQPEPAPSPVVESDLSVWLSQNVSLLPGSDRSLLKEVLTTVLAEDYDTSSEIREAIRDKTYVLSLSPAFDEFNEKFKKKVKDEPGDIKTTRRIFTTLRDCLK